MTILTFPYLIALAAGAALLAGCGSTPGGTASLAPSSLAQEGAAGTAAPSVGTASAEFSDQRPEALGGRESSKGDKPADPAASASGADGRSDNRKSADKTSDGRSHDSPSDDASDDSPSDDMDPAIESPVAPPAPTPVPPPPAALARVEIEGFVLGTDPVLMTLTVDGVTVTVPPTAVIRHGHQTIPFPMIQAGDRVHIKATAGVADEPPIAHEVKVQRPARAIDDSDDDDPPPPAPAPAVAL